MSDKIDNKDNIEPKYSLPGNHIDITDKKETIDLSKILSEDCELILFEIPKNFDKEKLKQMKLKPVLNPKNSQEMSFMKGYKCISYGENHPSTKQTLTVLKKKKILFVSQFINILKFMKQLNFLSLKKMLLLKEN